MSWDQSSTPPSPPASIGDVPVEILHDIFALACADGGKTGCALAQVSRHIRGASRAVRFRIVSLPYGSLRKLRTFVDTFTRAQEDAARERATMPRVYHLCVAVAPRWSEDPGVNAEAIREMEAYSQPGRSEALSDPGDECPGCSSPPNSTSMPSDVLHSDEHLSGDCCTSAVHPPDPERDYPRISRDYYAVLQSILAHVATDLESLCFLGPCVSADVDSKRFWQTCRFFLPRKDVFFREPKQMPPFVRLRELSLSGDGFQDDCGYTHSTVEHDGDHDWPLLFPALERIVMTPHDGYSCDIMWWFCVAHAAKVRQLRLVLDGENEHWAWYGDVKRFIGVYLHGPIRYPCMFLTSYISAVHLVRQALQRRLPNNAYRPNLDLGSLQFEVIARMHPSSGPDESHARSMQSRLHSRTLRIIECAFSGSPSGYKYEIWLPEEPLSNPYQTRHSVSRHVSADALNIPLDDMLRRDWLHRALSPL